ncbi:LytR/AlgR family response regulator transcription factor [Gaoshiqia sp. Z1-71]|uniref:LytR/AlgR family response regulator transcription factor n=1 Tax=Gaoshiqia hydrogeniformans TaxID=3290090 RepID=UPI003BF7B008
MKVLIIEDEEPAVVRLKKLLDGLDDPVEVLDCLESVSQSAAWLAANPAPELVFMDIRLADGLSFEIFDLVQVNAPVIFTTAYNEYALKAFKVNSIDYLLKPVNPAELQSAVNKYKTWVARPGTFVPAFQENMQKLLSHFAGLYKTRFFIKVGQRYRSVPVHETESFFVQEKSSFMRTTDGKTLGIDYSLDQLAGLLDPELFFRVNRNFLVNINCISEVLIYSGSRLKLKLRSGNYPETILVSRDKVSPFKRWMDR